MRHSSFNWVFREFLRKKSPYPLASRLGRSEKLIYAWSMDEDNPFHRRDPLSYAMDTLLIIHEHMPELAFKALQEIAHRLGYRLEPYPSSEQEVPFKQLLKELNDVEEALVDEENDLVEDLKEVEEAIYSLLMKRAELKKKLIEKAERERKPSQRR